MNLQSIAIEIFLPMVMSTGPNEKQTTAAFFPGYLFMRFDLETDNPSRWQWTPGLRYIVSYGDRPVPVPDEIITLIGKKLEDLEKLAATPSLKFKPGDIVRINTGPFQEMLGIFDGPTTPSARVHVLLLGMNNAARLRITATALEKVSGPTEISTDSRRRRTRGRGRRIMYKKQ